MRLDKLSWYAVAVGSSFYHKAELRGGDGGEIVIYHDHPEETYEVILISRTGAGFIQVHARYDDMDVLSAQAVLYHLLGEVTDDAAE